MNEIALTNAARGRQPRIPLRALPIMLRAKDMDAPMAANGLNLSVGGLSIRGSDLPNVGSYMQCEFSDPASAVDVSAWTEVVWTRNAGQSDGEFGLRFLNLNEDEQKSIENLVADANKIVPVDEAEKLAEDTIPDELFCSAQEEESSAPLEERAHKPPLVHFLVIVAAVRVISLIVWARALPVLRGIGVKLRAIAKQAYAWLARMVPRLIAATLSGLRHMLRFARHLITRTRVTRRRIVVQQVQPRRRVQGMGATQRNAKRPGFLRINKHVVTFMLAISLAGTSAAMVIKNRRTHLQAQPESEQVAQEDSPKVMKEKQPITKTDTQKPKPEVKAIEKSSMTQRIAELADFSELFDKTYFGSQVIENPHSFLVKMSQPVKRLQGVSTSQGFTVTIPNSLSLTDASTIAKGNPLVEYAAILNYDDYSRLTVKFVSGARPDYRVQATGSNLEVTIGTKI